MMRKANMGIEEAKKQILALRGEPVTVSVNKGRKKIVRYDGRVGGVYPSVFTLQILGHKTLSTLSCSYSDYICGDIEIVKKA